MTAGSEPISVWGNTTPSFMSYSSSVDRARHRAVVPQASAKWSHYRAAAPTSQASRKLYSRCDDGSSPRSLVLAAFRGLGGRRRAARRGGRLFDGGRGRQPVGVSRDVHDDGFVRASDTTGAHRTERNERDHPPSGGRRVG